MIRFSLHCDHGHEFEGWFRDNADFERQSEMKLVRHVIRKLCRSR